MQVDTINIQSKVKTITDADIIPEDTQNTLMYWRDVFRAGQFDIGDIANDLCLRASRQGFNVTQDRIFRAVGTFCGKSGRTVRYYCETARFYAPDVRSEYNMLTFSHFVLARYMGDNWRDVLDYARDHPNISEDNLRLTFTVFADVPTETTVEPDQVFADVETGLMYIDPMTGTGIQKNKSTTALHSDDGSVEKVLEELETVMSHFRLRNETQRKIALLMQEFRDLIPEVVREIED